MSANQDMTSIHTQVEKQLPTMENQSNEVLYAMIGRGIVFQGAAFLVSPTEEELTRAGKQFVETHQGIHEVICNADNKSVILGAIDVTSITAVVSLLVPIFGFPPTAVPAAVIALAVLIFKIGVNQFCRGYQPKN